MKYIMTGHFGLIGKPLNEKLKSLGHKCVEEIDKRFHQNTTYVDQWSINADVVFHLADNCKINKCIEDPSLAFENVHGIYSVLEMCRKNKIKKIVYFSSSRVLSKEKNPYTAGKLYGEELVKAYNKCYGIDYIIIRPSTVYGGEDITNRLMNIWINNAKKDEPLKIFGNSNKTLCFTYIDDFVDAIIESLEGWNRDYNIGGSEVYLSKVAGEIIKQTNSKSKIELCNPEIEQPQTVSLKSDFICSTNFKEGIKKCL